jgi:hypothetical protein
MNHPIRLKFISTSISFLGNIYFFTSVEVTESLERLRKNLLRRIQTQHAVHKESIHDGRVVLPHQPRTQKRSQRLVG